MATQDINANIHIKDESGNINNIYPATKIANVEGLQSALNAKANSSDVTSGLAGKVDKETGKGLSTNDYTTAEKNKLAGIATGATAVTVDAALSTTSTNAIQNKAVKTALDVQTAELATKANITDVNAAMAEKADVDTVAALSDRVSDVEEETSGLQGQIDQIVISSSAESVVAPEVASARVAENGTAYSTLKSRLDSEKKETDLAVEVNEQATFRQIKKKAYLAEKVGAYKKYTVDAAKGDIIYLESLQFNDLVFSVRKDSSSGEMMKNTSPLPWIVTETYSQYFITVRRSNSSELPAVDDINCCVDVNQSMIEDNTTRINDNSDDIYKMSDVLLAETRIHFNVADRKYLDTSGDTVNLNDFTEGTVLWRIAIVDCKEGDKFSGDYIVGGVTGRAWAFIDSGSNILEKAEESVEWFGTITAPANSAKLIVQDCYDHGNLYKINESNIESECKKIVTTDIIEWRANKAISYPGGADYDSQVFKASKAIYTNNATHVKVTMPVYMASDGTRPMYGLVFFGRNSFTTGGYQIKSSSDINHRTAEEVVIEIPSGTRYFKTTYYNDNYSGYEYDGNYICELLGNVQAEIVVLSKKVETLETSFDYYSAIGSPSPYIVKSDSSYNFTVTLQNVYDKFDEFCANYPTLIKKESNIGMDESNTYEMRHYSIKPMKPAIFSTRTDAYIRDDSNNQWDDTNKNYGFKRILLTLGMHSGAETESMKGTIAFIEDLLSSDNEWAMYIKNNFIIDIIPCINPYGLVNNKAENVNNVNINRDFINLSQAESKNVKALIDELVTKGLVGVIDTHNTSAGGDGYWVTKTKYKYYNDYIRMSQQLNRLITPLCSDLYGADTYNGVHFYLWNYGSGETGQMHEYADALGLLSVSVEARNNVSKTYLATQMQVGNIIQMFGAFNM